MKRPILCLLAVITAAGTAVGWDCFKTVQPVKYNPMPFCSDGTKTKADDKGWQCYKYWIYDSGYGWDCMDSADNEVGCQMTNTSVTVTEWGGTCGDDKYCHVYSNDVLYYKELWPGSYAVEKHPCGGG